VSVLPFSAAELAAIAEAKPGVPYRGMPAPRPAAEELAETRGSPPRTTNSSVPGNP